MNSDTTDTGDPNELVRLPSSYYFITIFLSNKIRPPIHTIESAEPTLATVLVTEGSPFVEHGLYLDHPIMPMTTLEDFAMMASELKFVESEPWAAMEAEGLAELRLKCLPFDARHRTCCGLQTQHMIVR